VIGINNIFIGILLLFINFDVHFGNMTVGTVPNFLGFYFILKGLSELAELSERFDSMKIFAKAMIFYAMVIYGLNLLGIFGALGILSYALTAIAMGIQLFIYYNIVMGIRDIELASQTRLGARRLHALVIYMSIFYIMGFAFFFYELALFGLIAGFVTNFTFLYAFYRTKKEYYAAS